MADRRLLISSDNESDIHGNTSKNVSSQQTNDINVVKHLSFTDKGKFRWTGSFENLEIMMNELLETQVIWTSPGGYCKLLETENLEMRWYSNNFEFYFVIGLRH